MSLEEFNKWLESQPIEDKLVYMRYKYSWEDKWTYSNEVLEADCSVDGFYVWINDWDEGQEHVEILGCVSIDEIEIPLFGLPVESEERNTKGFINADELLKRIADKASKSKNLDVINGLCGAVAIVYDMLEETGQEKEDEAEE